MIEKKCPSFPVSIFMAGGATDAVKYCQLYCNDIGLCVTVTPSTYVYTGGQENGFIVGLINYPRFPASGDALTDRAIDLGHELMRQLGQQSFSVQTPFETHWFSRRAEATP
jgi:hypothetical protein